jgi:hypothetical protein
MFIHRRSGVRSADSSTSAFAFSRHTFLKVLFYSVLLLQ